MHKLDDILGRTPSLEPPAWAHRPPVQQHVWEEAVGSRIARRTEPVRVERGVLFVRVANAAWANELSLLAEDILKELGARGIDVHALRFTVGPISPRQWKQQRLPVRLAPPDNPPLPERIRTRVAEIEDDDLGRAIARAAAKSLAIPDKQR